MVLRVTHYSASYIMIVIALLVMPACFGGESLPAVVMLTVLVMVMMFVWLMEGHAGTKKYRFIHSLFVPILCYFGVMLLIFFQLFQGKATLLATLPMMCYPVIFLIVMFSARIHNHAQLLLYSVAIISTVYAVFGLVQFSVMPENVLWIKKTHYQDALTATFMSRNVCAVYFGLGILTTAALMMQTIEKRANARCLGMYSVMLCVQVIALYFTFSRSGFLATFMGCVSLIVFMSFSSLLRHHQKWIISGLGIGIIMIGFLFYSTITTSNQRWDSLQNSLYERGLLMDGVIQLITEHPWDGSGFGNFERAYLPVAPEALHQLMRDRHDRLIHAHNSYAELLVEIGIPATCALLFCFGSGLMRCWQGVRKRRKDAIYSALGLAATMLVATNALLDYSLAVPAVALMYNVVMAVGVAQSWSSVEANDYYC